MWSNMYTIRFVHPVWIFPAARGVFLKRRQAGNSLALEQCMVMSLTNCNKGFQASDWLWQAWFNKHVVNSSSAILWSKLFTKVSSHMKTMLTTKSIAVCAQLGMLCATMNQHPCSQLHCSEIHTAEMDHCDSHPGYSDFQTILRLTAEKAIVPRNCSSHCFNGTISLLHPGGAKQLQITSQGSINPHLWKIQSIWLWLRLPSKSH